MLEVFYFLFNSATPVLLRGSRNIAAAYAIKTTWQVKNITKLEIYRLLGTFRLLIHAAAFLFVFSLVPSARKSEMQAAESATDGDLPCCVNGRRNNETANVEEGQVAVLKRQSFPGSASHLLAGGIAGAFSKTCTAPLARLTILFQLQGMQTEVAALGRPSIVREASRIAIEEGFRAFWKGNGVTIVHRLPYSAISFYSYEKYKRFLLGITGINGRQESLSFGMGTNLLAGGGAGLTAASSTYPLDLIRTRLAAQRNERYYKGIGHAVQTIFRDEGLKGLYKGLGTTLLGVGPNIALNFCVYDTLKSFATLGRSEYSGPWTSLVCGSVAGITSSTVSFPLDLVRRRMQLEGAAGKAPVYKSGIAGTFMQIVKSEGWSGLYRGILPEYLKVVPSVGIVFMTYESIKRWLSGD